MISFMISVVAPKFHEIRGLPSGTGFQESSWIRRGLFPGGCAQDVAGEIAGGPARSGARPRTAFAVSIATATWLAIIRITSAAVNRPSYTMHSATCIGCSGRSHSRNTES
jgi:hypothetical protein